MQQRLPEAVTTTCPHQSFHWRPAALPHLPSACWPQSQPLVTHTYYYVNAGCPAPSHPHLPRGSGQRPTTHFLPTHAHYLSIQTSLLTETIKFRSRKQLIL